MNLAAILLDLVGQVLSNPIVVTGVMVMGLALVAGWLLATVWAFQDMAHRSDSLLGRYLAATWVLLSGPILLPLSLPILAFLRPLERAADGRLKRLIEALQVRTSEASACGLCGVRLNAQWVRCPWCAAWTGQQCRRCENWVPADADICPWCTWTPGGPLEQPTVPVPAFVDQPAAAGAAAPGVAAAVAGRQAAPLPVATASVALEGPGRGWAAMVRADPEPSPRSA